MEELSHTSEVLLESFKSFGQQFSAALPSVIGAVLILLIGWIVAKIVSGVIGRILKVVKFEKLADKVGVNGMLEKSNIKMDAGGLICKFIYWIMMLLVIITASDALGWNAVSREISKLIGYMPQLLAAIVFFIIGVYIATFVKDLILGATRSLGISAGKVIGSFVFYMLIILVTLTALDQAGVKTDIITSNLLIILGSIMLAAGISYGFASRDVLSNILGSYFSRRTYSVGQTIDIDGNRGKILTISNVAVTLQLSDNEQLVIPSAQLINKQVKIIS